MSEGQAAVDAGEGGRSLASTLPKTALQAIYHAVTGKTENMRKALKGNVLIRRADFDRLYGMLIDLTSLYKQSFSPVVTVVVKNDSDKSVTYSSWERFCSLQVNNHDLTSDITLKIEFVIKLPGTDRDQRCVISVNLDSSLPVIDDRGRGMVDMDEFGFFLQIFGREWRTADVSIDFVDYLVAKSFLNVIEEWFSSLEKMPKKKMNDFLFKNNEIIRNSLNQLGRMGMAAFLISFVYFIGSDQITLSRVTVAISLGLVIWSFFAAIDSFVIKFLFSRLAKNMLPSVVLISDKDISVFSKVKSSLNSPANTIIIFLFTCIINILINIYSSYIYSIITVVKN